MSPTQYRTRKVPRLRFREFSGEWQEKKLGDLAKIKTGGRDVQDAESRGLYPFFVRSDKIERINSYSYNGEAILIPGEGNIGKIFHYIIGKFEYHQRVYKVSDFSKETHGKFIYYYFVKNFGKQAMTNSVKATVDSLRLPTFTNFGVNLPSVKEQQKIAGFLTTVDDKISALQNKKGLLEKYKKGIMQVIFSQKIRFKDEDGKNYPDWQEKKLGKLVEFSRGASLSKSDITDDGTYECVHYGELFTEYDEVINTVKSHTNTDTKVDSEIGDILMPTSDVTPQGLARASAILKDGVKLGGDINILKPNDGLNSAFLSYMLNFLKKKIMRVVSGTTVRHVYSKDIAKIVYAIPSNLPEQQKIADFLTSIDEKIDLTERELEQAKRFKNGLLQQIFV